MIVDFDPATGRILGGHEALDDAAYIALLRRHGRDGIPLGTDGTRYYVRDGAIVPRPDSAIALDRTTVAAGGVEAVTLSGVPAGAKLRLIGPSVHELEGTGEPLQLGFALPGVYEIQVEAFPYRDAIFRVSVTE